MISQQRQMQEQQRLMMWQAQARQQELYELRLRWAQQGYVAYATHPLPDYNSRALYQEQLIASARAKAKAIGDRHKPYPRFFGIKMHRCGIPLPKVFPCARCG